MNKKKEQKTAKKGIKSHVTGGKYKSVPGDKILKISPVSQKESKNKMGIITDGPMVQYTGKCKRMQGSKDRAYRLRPGYKLFIEEIKEEHTGVGSSDKKKGVRKSEVQIFLHKRNPVPDRPRPVTGKPKPQSDYKQGGQDKTKKENET